MAEQEAFVQQRSSASCSGRAISTPSGRRLGSLLSLAVATMFVCGLSLTATPAASAVVAYAPHSYAGPAPLGGNGSQPAPTALGEILDAGAVFATPDQVSGATGTDSQRRFVPGEVVVQFRPGVAAQGRTSVLKALDATRKRRLSLPGVQLVRVGGETVPEAVASFERRPQVLYAEPNFIGTIDAIPNDPLFSDQWTLKNTGQRVDGTSGTPDADIDAPEAWNVTTGSDSVTVGVIDTGIAYDHPDLSPNIWTNPGESGGGKETNGIDDDGNGFIDDWRGWDFVDEDNDPRDFNEHGSTVAGTIGARGDNGQGVTGVNWNVGLMPVRAGDAGGSITDVHVAEGIAYAVANGAKVVNASFGFSGFSMVMLEAIEDSPNTLFVAAAGNDGVDNEIEPHYPCAYSVPNVVCVAATDQSDELASFSNFGASSVDLGAPGTNVLGPVPAYGPPVFSEDFESPIDATWTTGGTNDSWARTQEASSGGSVSLTDSPGGEYLNGTDSFARPANPFSLAGKSGCQLNWQMNLATEPGDGLWTEASTASSFAAPTIRAGLTGSTGSFVGVRLDLSAVDGASEVFIRFRLKSNGDTTNDGAHIDDVKVRCLTSTFTGNEFESFYGTSMAAPHVTGTAALIWAETPGASVAAVKTALLSTTEAKASLAGKTVTGGRLNANLAVGGGPFEEPEEEGGDGGKGGGGSGNGGGTDGGSSGGEGGSGASSTVRPRIARPAGIANAVAVAQVKGGKAFLKLACRGGAGACQGSLKLVALLKAGKEKSARASRKRVSNLVVGRSDFSIPAGQTKTIRVQLTGKGKRLLRKAGKRGLKVKLRGNGISNRAVRLKQKKRTRKSRLN
jgi:thermitase